MVPDKYHGVGGSYIRDAETGERKQMEGPTAPSPEGGARDKDGKPLDKPHPKTEPAFAPPVDDALGRAPGSSDDAQHKGE